MELVSEGDRPIGFAEYKFRFKFFENDRLCYALCSDPVPVPQRPYYHDTITGVATSASAKLLRL